MTPSRLTVPCLSLALASCVFEASLDKHDDELRAQAERATRALAFENAEPVTGDVFGSGGPELASMYSPLSVRVGEPFSLRITAEAGAEVAGVLFVIDHAPRGWRMPARMEEGALVVSGTLSADADFDRAVRFGNVALVDGSGRRGALVPMPLQVSPNDAALAPNLRGLFTRHRQVTAVAFPPEGPGDTLLVASEAGDLTRWDLDEGRPTLAYEGSSSRLFSVVVSRDRRFVASGDAEGTIRIHDLESGAERLSADVHQRPVTALTFGRESRRLLSGSWDGTVRRHDLQSSESEVVAEPGVAVNAIALSSDERYIALATGRLLHEGQVVLVDTAMNQVRPMGDSPREATAVSFSNTTTQLAAGFGRGAVWVWTLGEDAPRELLGGPDDAVAGLAFIGESHLFVAHLNGHLAIWDLAQRKLLRDVQTGSELLSMALSSSGRELAIGNGEGSVVLFEFGESPAAGAP